MKVLATGDIHGDVSFVEVLAHEADRHDVDVIVIAGDIANWHGSTDNLIGPLLRDKRTVCILPGNHDTFLSAEMLSQQYGVVNLHDEPLVKDGIMFFGCGGANMGLEGLEEQEIYDIIMKNYSAGEGKVKFMVTHVHPEGSKMQHATMFVPPSTGVRRAIDTIKPHIHVCGHVHEAGGIEEKIGDTHVFNVSRSVRIFDL